MTEELVRLKAGFGTDEVNCRSVSYKVNRWGCVCVPVVDVPPLLKVGGFSRAIENDPTAPNSSLSDVAEVCWHLPKGKVRDTLLAILRSPNSMSHLYQDSLIMTDTPNRADRWT
jgi:hypothetical protein